MPWKESSVMDERPRFFYGSMTEKVWPRSAESLGQPHHSQDVSEKAKGRRARRGTEQLRCALSKALALAHRRTSLFHKEDTSVLAQASDHSFICHVHPKAFSSQERTSKQLNLRAP
jgi:hypothetical protein